MKVIRLFSIVLWIACSCFIHTSCKKDSLLTTSGGILKFSADTLTFDTVFTAAGSFTTYLKIYNPQNQKVTVSNVRLQNGNNSYFHLNVDGFPGNSVSNLTIAPHDSIYVFATVKIDPTDTNTPFVVTDNLIATLNGNEFSVPFEAYGQNAIYIIDSVLEGTNNIWDDKLPYVVLHGAAVDTAAVLTIKAGCHIYMNADSRLFVIGRGKLLAQGTKDKPVIFQGDRLDRAYFGYQGYPGEWGGLYFGSYSVGNILDYVILENCGNSAFGASPAAIEVYIDSVNGAGVMPVPASNYQLRITHSIIQNSIGYGLLSFGGSVMAQNCLINTCGAQGLAFIEGGYYDISNCTVATYPTDKVNHTDNPSGAVQNWYYIDKNTIPCLPLVATIRNTIFWGTLSTELVCSAITNPQGYTASVTLQNCLVKADSIAQFVNNTGNIVNQDPLFSNYQKFDFHIKTGSPAIGSGTPILTSGNTDLDGVPWTIPYGIGCYQYKP